LPCLDDVGQAVQSKKKKTRPSTDSYEYILLICSAVSAFYVLDIHSMYGSDITLQPGYPGT